jgi:prostaglandin-H2 D-isomerase / glutathione transferase
MRWADAAQQAAQQPSDPFVYAARSLAIEPRIPMSKPRLTYFDFAGSRGEECRIALHLAGIDFEDVRVKSDDWLAMKANMPFGAMPVLEIPGRAPLPHSNAILVFIGRQHRLHPTDAFAAARHEALMCAVEELRHSITPTLRISDPEQKRVAREALAANELATWGSQVEAQLGDGPFVGGQALQVADIKLYMVVRWLTSGTLDHVPTTVLDHCPKLLRLYRAVGEHPGVKAWLAKTAH